MNTQKMKAIVCTKYGLPDFLQVKEVIKPTPKTNEILVKVYATTATAADTMMRKADPFISRFFMGLTKPNKDIIGTGFSGIIESIGNDVKDFKVGDSVFGETGVNFGANAEYICMPEDGVIMLKPENISFEEAAPLCDGALTSFNFLREVTRVKGGQKVLINGASGSLGTAAIQIAKYFGAKVTGVCSSSNFELVESLGADNLIDYRTTDFTENGETYDIIYDTVGKLSFSKCKQSLSKNGVYMSPVLDLGLLFQMMLTSIFGDKKAKFSATGLRPAPELRTLLKEVKKMIEFGKIQSVIDRLYPLEKTAEAHRYVDTGRKRGNVVITI